MNSNLPHRSAASSPSILTRTWLGVWLGLLPLLARPLSGAGQSTEVQLIEGQRATESPSGAITPLAGAKAYYVLAQATGVGAFEPVQNPSMKPPVGATRPLSKLNDDAYGILQDFSTAQARDAAFPLGRYDFSATVNLLGLVKAHALLSPSTFPPFPKVTNASATQTIDASADFTLQWESFPTPGQDDVINLLLVDDATHEVVTQNTSMDPTTQEWTFSAGDLAANKTYSLTLQFARAGEYSPLDADELLPGRMVSLSETSLTLKTGSGSTGTGDVTPPVLTLTFPTNATTMTSPLSQVIFQFSEPMDTSKNSIQWNATLNGLPVLLDSTKFIYTWIDTGTTLAVSYNLLGGGWPPGHVVQWKLNAIAGQSGNFRDVAGNELSPVTGFFNTAGGIDPCSGTGNGSLDDAGFFFTKQVHYIQVGTGTPTQDPDLGPQAFAFFNAPGSGLYIGVVTLKVPTSNPFQFHLKPLTPIKGSPDASLMTFEETFTSRSDLDDAYPAGNYVLELRDTTVTVTNSVTLVVSATGYPPTPHFSNAEAAQKIASEAPFTLSWDPFTGAKTNSETVSVTISDSQGAVVFQAPDPCHNVSLAPDASGVVIPANTLKAGESYSVELSFGRFNDRNKTLPGIPGFGFTLLSRTTKTVVKTATAGGSVTPARFTQIRALSPQQLSVELTCTPGKTLLIEQAPTLGENFTTLLTTNPIASPLILNLQINQARGFIRARNP